MKKKRGLVSCIQEFKKDTILTPIFVIGEVAFDVLIPMMTGRLLTQGVEAGNPETYAGQLKPILSNENIFGVNLYDAGIGSLTEAMFLEEIAGVGAVRETLRKYLN